MITDSNHDSFKVRRCWSHYMRYGVEKLRRARTDLLNNRGENDPRQFFRGPWDARAFLALPIAVLGALFALPLYWHDRRGVRRRRRELDSQMLDADSGWCEDYTSAETLGEVWRLSVGSSRFDYLDHETAPLLRLFVAELYSQPVTDRLKIETLRDRFRVECYAEADRSPDVHFSFGLFMPAAVEHLDLVLPQFRETKAAQTALTVLIGNEDRKN